MSTHHQLWLVATPSSCSSCARRGMPCVTVSREALASLAQPRRETAGCCWSSICATSQQFRRRSPLSSASTRPPACCSSPRQLDPALMLEAMRAGRERVRHAIRSRRRSFRPRSSGWWAIWRRPRAATSSRSSAPKGASARRPSRSTSRRRWRSRRPRLDAADRSERRLRRRGRVPGRRAALLGDGRARERPAARRRVLQRARRAQQVRPRSARRVRATGHGALRCQPHPHAARFREPDAPVHGARRAALRLRGARLARDARRRSCSSRIRSWRRCATPAAWRRRCGSATARPGSVWSLTRTDRRAEIGLDDVERTVGIEISHTFPSDYRLALQAMNKGRPIVLDATNELATASPRSRASWPALRPERRTRGTDQQPVRPAVPTAKPDSATEGQ